MILLVDFQLNNDGIGAGGRRQRTRPERGSGRGTPALPPVRAFPASAAAWFAALGSRKAPDPVFVTSPKTPFTQLSAILLGLLTLLFFPQKLGGRERGICFIPAQGGNIFCTLRVLWDRETLPSSNGDRQSAGTDRMPGF